MMSLSKTVITTAMLAASFISLSANAATKVTFTDGSYCGSFAGNLQDGKDFSLWLMPEQELIIRNTGDDQISVAYVKGPKGRLDAVVYDNVRAYYTEAKGNHQIRIYGNSYHSMVEFCAY